MDEGDETIPIVRLLMSASAACRVVDAERKKAKRGRANMKGCVADHRTFFSDMAMPAVLVLNCVCHQRPPRNMHAHGHTRARTISFSISHSPATALTSHAHTYRFERRIRHDHQRAAHHAHTRHGHLLPLRPEYQKSPKTRKQVKIKC